MKIEPLNKKNIDECSKMLSTYWKSIGENYSINYAKKYIKQGHRTEIIGDKFFILKEKGEIAGIISLILFCDTSAEVRDFYIKPRFRGKGYGDTLLKYLIGWAKKNRLRMVFAKSLKYSLNLFKKHGFKQEGKLKDFFVKGIDVYFMTKHFRK